MDKKTKKNTDAKVNKEEYDNFIKNLELLNLYLSECRFKRADSELGNHNIEVTASLELIKNEYKQLKDNTFEVRHSVNFILSFNKDSKKIKLFELKAVFMLIYKNKIKITDEIFDLFSKKNIPLNIMPYLREFVTNSMYRTGLPPILLPVTKI
jgi:preprotein translocase subunit SecB